jgi:hypothetical protein
MIETQWLSLQDFKEFKGLVVEEYGNTMSDEEIREMALRLLGLYDMMYSPLFENNDTRLSKHEIVAFVYIKTMLCNFRHSPSVREIARFLGRRSSRSGQKVLDRLSVKGLVGGRSDGKLKFDTEAIPLLRHLGQQSLTLPGPS